MCLAQGPQRSDAGETRTRGPSVSSQALYHWATALPKNILLIRTYDSPFIKGTEGMTKLSTPAGKQVKQTILQVSG